MLVAGTLAFVGLQAGAQWIEDDFDAGHDNAWTRLDPIGEGEGGTYAAFSFPNGGYRIQALASPLSAQWGPGRAGSIREDAVFADFQVAVDLVTFTDDTGLDPVVGAVARISDPGFGTTKGYALYYQHYSYSLFSPALALGRITNEGVTELALTSISALDPAKSYRFVFTGTGTSLQGALYDLDDLSSPLEEVVAADGTYASGFAGLFIYDGTPSGDQTADATFDNFMAIPEPGSVLLVLAGAVLMSTLRRRRRA